MDDLPTSGDGEHAAHPAEKPPIPPETIVGAPNDKKAHGKGRKCTCCRKLRKAPIWIEATCAMALVVITGLYTHYAWQQVQGTQTAIEEARKQNRVQNHLAERSWVAQTRPWVGLLGDVEPISGQRIRWKVKNYGSSVARRIVVKAYLIDRTQRGKWKQPDMETKHGKFGICNDAADDSTNYNIPIGESWGLAFPQEYIGSRVEGTEVADLRQGTGEFIAVCVVYQGVQVAVLKSRDQNRFNIPHLYHEVILYRVITPMKMERIDADAYDEPDNW